MRPRPHWPSIVWAAGAAGVVFAARLREIRAYTGDVAINDQWKIEAADLLAPWLEGTLRPWVFFSPHFEHVPMWTRLTAWLEVALTGRWDPFVQTTVNAALYAGFVALFTHWVAKNLRPAGAIGVTLLLVFASILPHAWENITWGFQSQFPFALIFLFLHVRGSVSHGTGTRAWWRAQAAGIAGLFTLAGMWIAPVAVVLTCAWVGPSAARRRWIVPALIAVAGLGMIAVVRAHAPPQGAFAQTAGSPLHFLHALIDLMGWPAGRPGAFILLNIPLVVFAFQLRARRLAASFDQTVLALGLWGLGQAAALAFARGADYGGYVSRYGELLLILVLANALAIARILPGLPWRKVSVALAGAWLATTCFGWWELAHGGHTAYFHLHASAHAQARREAVQSYLQDRDRSRLEAQATRWILYQDVDQVTRLLDDPRFQALLPTSVNPSNPPDAAGTFVRSLQYRAEVIGGVTALLLAAGAFCLARARPAAEPAPRFIIEPTPRLHWFSGAVALAALSLVACWPRPLTFGATARWHALLNPPGAIGPLGVELVTGSETYPGERLVGAAPLAPPSLQRLFTGTAPEGPALTCTAWSRPFDVTTPWLVVPHAGWPVAHGNGLRLRIEEKDGRFITEVDCQGPNPAWIGFWAADVREYVGLQARLVLYDGRPESESWVAASAPIATADRGVADTLAKELAWERLAGLHSSLGLLALVAGLGSAVGFWCQRRHPAPGSRLE
ncbi:MAG: hypothetical protein KF897_07815 [Opitutaceae bacterium]|nr:hypothetical protein [Opitutaceae bacterium]